MKLSASLAVLLVALMAGSSALAMTTGFIENRGQIDEQVNYYTLGSGLVVYLTPEALVFNLKEPLQGGEDGRNGEQHARDGWEKDDPSGLPPRQGCAVWIRFERPNPSPVIKARGELAAKFNYFLGEDPAQWRTDVPAYSEIVYDDLWPGVDLVCREEGGVLTYEVVAAAGSDPGRVAFRYEGAERIIARADGSFQIDTAVGCLAHERFGDEREEGRFLWKQKRDHPDGTQSSPGQRDNPEALLWSTFLGGNDADMGRALTLDPGGNPVVTGYTHSSDFPTTPGAYDELFNGGWDVFVSKLSASGSDLLWSTFLGGSHWEGGWVEKGPALVLGHSGNPVVTGYTDSSDFPTTPGAYDESYNWGGNDAFVFKLSASGSDLLWSTFLGGGNWDRGYALALDPDGNPVVTGYTGSSDFPTTSGAYDESYNSGPYSEDVFVSKLSASGSNLLWSTFLGGSDSDQGYALALDPGRNPVVTGYTESPDFPTTPGAYDESYHEGHGDVFVSKLSASGSDLLCSTFLGGSDYDGASALCLDADGNPVVTGVTGSSDLPTTPGAYDESINGDYNVFVSKLSASGSDLLWSTFLGGCTSDQGYSLALDRDGNPVVTGQAESPDFPTTPGAYDESYNGGWHGDAFVSRLSASGSDLLWSTFLGGSDWDQGYALALDPDGNPVVTGFTISSDFPTTPGAYDESINGAYDVFVSKLEISEVSEVEFEPGPHSSPMFLEVARSPSILAVTIRYQIPRDGPVTLDVFDSRGRLVTNLLNRRATAGKNVSEWSIRGTDGRRVSPGIYFVRLMHAEGNQVRKAVILR